LATHTFTTSFLSVRFSDPLGLNTVCHEQGPFRHIVEVGEVRKSPTEPAAWRAGGCGLRVVTTRSQHHTVQAMIDAGALHPAGGPAGLISRPWGGVPALWREQEASPGYFGVFAVHGGYFHLVQWRRSPSDPCQGALLAGLIFLPLATAPAPES